MAYHLRSHIRVVAASAMLAAAFSDVAAHPVANLQAGEWYEVPNSKLSSVDPCPAANCSYSGIEGQPAVIDDWNGGAFATRYGAMGGYIVWGGGHNGYLGNELYVFDVAQLAWQRVTNPVTNPVCNYTEAELQDGSPCAPHTYDYVDYHPTSNSFVKLGSASVHIQGGGGSPRVHLFSFDENRWRRGARKPGSFVSHTGAASAYDPNRDVFWLVPAYNQPIGKYDPNAQAGSGAWTLYNAFNVDILIVGAIDPVHDLFVFVDGNGTQAVYAFDLKNPNEVIRLRTTGDLTVQSKPGAGFEWDPVERVFVAWIGGTSVYTLTPPPSGDWRTQTWTWTRRAPAASNRTVPTSPNANDTYSRWRYVPTLNAWMVVNRTTDNVYFYKLSAGGATAAPNPPTGVSVR